MVKSKYDTVEDKFIYLPDPKISKNRLSTFNFRGNSFGKSFSKKTINSEVPRKLLVSPPSLAFLAANVVDKLETPKPMFWTLLCVKKFIARLGFTQYTKTFTNNLITGRILLLFDASALVKMNITNFEHMKVISQEIRKLYQFEEILFSRSISLPPRYPLTHSTIYHRLRGPRYQCCRASDLFQKMKLIDLSTDTDDHWTRLEKWLRHEADTSIKKIGYTPRDNLYKYQKHPMQLENSRKNILCECIPPCECNWTDADMQGPKTISCLLDIPNKGAFNINSFTELPQREVHRAQSLHGECWCETGSLVNITENVLSILKTAMPKKYDTRVHIKL